MSDVKLIVEKRNSLDFGKVTNIVLELQQNDQVIGVIETNFEPEEDGSVRSSDGIDPVITTHNINYLVGQILTLVEASITDPEQRKAAKDLYMQTVWGWYTAQTDRLSRAWRFDKGFETDHPEKNYQAKMEAANKIKD